MGLRDDVTSTAWKQLEAIVGAAPKPELIDLADVAPPVRRYLTHAGAVRTAAAARLEMRGHIKLGRWLSFRARQLLAPRYGTVWAARVGGVIVGSDRYVGGTGGMDWRILGLIPVVHSTGPDVSRSAAERAAGEAIWVPSAVAPASGSTWIARDDEHIEVSFDVDGHPVTLRHAIGDSGALKSSSFDRWGDPDNSGIWQPLRFGVEVSREATFEGVTIPVEGRAGWHFGTDRWDAGCFFRFRITAHETVA
jgi:hypothetical protein